MATIKIPDKIRDRFKIMAINHGVTLSALVLEILEDASESVRINKAVSKKTKPAKQ